MMANRIVSHLLVLTLIFSILSFHGVMSAVFPYTVLERGPADLTVMAGETATFSCDMNTPARRDAIWWLFESSGCFLYISRNEDLRPTCGLNMNHYQSTIDHIHHIYTLQIDNVSDDDAGTYICKNESSLRGSAQLTVLPRNIDPIPTAPGDCADGVCCEVSYFPTGQAVLEGVEPQVKCSWSEKYNNINIHAHIYCNGVEIRGSNKVTFDDHAIGKIEPEQHNSCDNFSCEVEIVGESSVQDSCTITSDNNLQRMILRIEPEMSFVEEGSDAIFFCHVNNVRPTSGSFHWYIVHTHEMSINSISSNPIASTTGYYGKLQLSSVMLDDDFITVKCFFEPDNYSANYSKTGSNPAVLRVLRRTNNQISCFTSGKSSSVKCTDIPGENPNDSLNIWPMTIKEWVLAGTSLVLVFIVILLCRPVLHKKSPDRRHNRNRSMRMSDDVSPTSGTQSDIQLSDRYEYLTERYYDAPYSLLRNLRNFPRRLRNRVIHRDHARSAHPPRPPRTNHNTSPNLSYGSIDPDVSQSVNLRNRAININDNHDDDPSRRSSSDYDVLDATTMTVLQQSTRTSALASTSTSASASALPPTSTSATPPASAITLPVASAKTKTKKPKVTPKPLSPRPAISASVHLPSLPVNGDHRIDHQANGHADININNGYASPMASPVESRVQCRVGNDGYLEPSKEVTAYLDIC